LSTIVALLAIARTSEPRWWQRRRVRSYRLA